MTIADCDICGKLAETETSFSKYGWDEMDRSLPAEAARLVPVGDVSSYDAQRDHVRRCPVCGTYYRYHASYEYLVNGSEDTEELNRLTPTEARSFLTARGYSALMAQARANLRHPSALTRGYAGKCLMSHHLARNEMASAERYLSHPDADVAKGALFFLRDMIERGDPLPASARLERVLRKLAGSADPSVAAVAAFTLHRLEAGAHPAGG